MTWEETIEYIRDKPEYADLVEKAYFHQDIELNINRFGLSEEYVETLEIFKSYAPKANNILDIGCGNGISTINFAKEGYNVTAVEPDPSETIGAGAIKKMVDKLNLQNVKVYEEFAEDIKFNNHYFDIVYVRQAMHHAKDLNAFVSECIRVLKPGGLLLTVRDHVVYDENDKELFFKSHPLHKYYGGENAFKPGEYRTAITAGGASIKKELKYYDSIINYFPLTTEEVKQTKIKNSNKQKQKLRNKIGFLGSMPFVWNLYEKVSGYQPLNEINVPGRMYSYIAIKK